MNKMIFEILEEVPKCRTKNEKVMHLRRHDCPALRTVLNYGLNPDCRLYTDKVPPFKLDEAPTGLSYQTLYNVHRQMHIFLAPDLESRVTKKGPTAPHRKQQVLLQILESIDKNDAKVLLSIINKTFGKDYGISKQVVDEAFPGLIA